MHIYIHMGLCRVSSINSRACMWFPILRPSVIMAVALQQELRDPIPVKHLSLGGSSLGGGIPTHCELRCSGPAVTCPGVSLSLRLQLQYTPPTSKGCLMGPQCGPLASLKGFELWAPVLKLVHNGTIMGP